MCLSQNYLFFFDNIIILHTFVTEYLVHTIIQAEPTSCSDSESKVQFKTSWCNKKHTSVVAPPAANCVLSFCPSFCSCGAIWCHVTLWRHDVMSWQISWQFSRECANRHTDIPTELHCERECTYLNESVLHNVLHNVTTLSENMLHSVATLNECMLLT